MPSHSFTTHKEQRGHVLADINRAPYDAGELPAYFMSLPEVKLAACWVACITDAVIRGEAVRPLTLALIVVAERLHGVKFMNETAQTPRAVPIRPNAFPNKPDNPGPSAAVVPRVTGATLRQPVLTGPVETPRLAHLTPPAPKQVAGIDIYSGPPPAAKSRSNKSAAAHEAAGALLPGQWFIWEKPPGTFKKVADGWAKEFGFELLAYRVAPKDGVKRVVVRRPAPAAGATPS